MGVAEATELEGVTELEAPTRFDDDVETKGPPELDAALKEENAAELEDIAAELKEVAAELESSVELESAVKAEDSIELADAMELDVDSEELVTDVAEIEGAVESEVTIGLVETAAPDSPAKLEGAGDGEDNVELGEVTEPETAAEPVAEIEEDASDKVGVLELTTVPEDELDMLAPENALAPQTPLLLLGAATTFFM